MAVPAVAVIVTVPQQDAVPGLVVVLERVPPVPGVQPALLVGGAHRLADQLCLHPGHDVQLGTAVPRTPVLLTAHD